jgi:hypothetical protein
VVEKRPDLAKLRLRQTKQVAHGETPCVAFGRITVALLQSGQRGLQEGSLGIVAGKFGSGGGPPNVSGASDETSVALDGVVTTKFGAPIPEQSASASSAKTPLTLSQPTCFCICRVPWFDAACLFVKRPTASSGSSGLSRPLAGGAGAACASRFAVRMPPLANALAIPPLSQRVSVQRVGFAIFRQRCCWKRPDQRHRSRAPRPVPV